MTLHLPRRFRVQRPRGRRRSRRIVVVAAFFGAGEHLVLHTGDRDLPQPRRSADARHGRSQPRRALHPAPHRAQHPHGAPPGELRLLRRLHQRGAERRDHRDPK